MMDIAIAWANSRKLGLGFTQELFSHVLCAEKSIGALISSARVNLSLGLKARKIKDRGLNKKKPKEKVKVGVILLVNCS